MQAPAGQAALCGIPQLPLPTWGSPRVPGNLGVGAPGASPWKARMLSLFLLRTCLQQSRRALCAWVCDPRVTAVESAPSPLHTPAVASSPGEAPRSRVRSGQEPEKTKSAEKARTKTHEELSRALQDTCESPLHTARPGQPSPVPVECTHTPCLGQGEVCVCVYARAPDLRDGSCETGSWLQRGIMEVAGTMRALCAPVVFYPPRPPRSGRMAL